MTPLVEKGDPVVTELTVVARTVLLRLGNCSRMADGIGYTFLPEELEIEWRNGDLMEAVLTGTRLRADGNPFVAAPVSYRSFMGHGGKLAPDTPHWVSDLVNEYQ